MVKIQKNYILVLLCFGVSCHSENYLESTAGRPEFQKNSSRCFSDLSNLTEYSIPESCHEAGIFPTKVCNSLLMGMFRDSSFGVFFIESTGSLELLFGYDDVDLGRIRVFGPGSVAINGHICQKASGQLRCPVEALKHKPKAEPQN